MSFTPSPTSRGGAFTQRGGWSATTTYYQDDVVTWQNNQYQSLLPVNRNNQPDQVGSAWLLLGGIPNMAPGLVNLAPNPSFEKDTLNAAPFGWAFTGAAGQALTAVQSGWASKGSQSLRWTTNSIATSQQNTAVINSGHSPGNAAFWPVVPGQEIATLIDVNFLSYTPGGVPSIYQQVNWYTSASAFISAATTPASQRLTGNWPPGVVPTPPLVTPIQGTYSCVFTAPANAAFFQIFITAIAGSAGGPIVFDMYLDGFMLAYSPVPVSYVDGDSFGYMWAGTPGQSASVPIAPTASMPTCAGPPTWTPAPNYGAFPAPSPLGSVPMVYDTTTHKIWVYDAGWKGVVVA